MTFTYDALGRRTLVQDVSGATTYVYDAVSRLDHVVQPGGMAITYSYDAVGNRATMLDPTGGRTTYSFDAARRLTSLINPFTERTTWAYDVLGRATTMTLANQATATYVYDAAGRMAGLTNAKSDGTVISRFGYGYDAVGNPLTLTEATGDVVTWSYDALYELTREQRDGTYDYDITFTYDAANELLSEQTGATITTYTYDASGNLTVKNVAGALTTYTWDGENRMVVVGLQNGTLTTFAYDATGLRRRSQAGAATTNFVLDGQDVLLETAGGGTTQAAYTHRPGTYGPLVAQRRGGASIFHHFDALGSTTELTSAAAAVTDTYRYYAFGETRASTGSTTNPFEFVGRLGYYTEPTLALQYLRARWYQPASGRFLSRDPLGWAAAYPYASANPTWRTDPSGYQAMGEPPSGILGQIGWGGGGGWHDLPPGMAYAWGAGDPSAPRGDDNPPYEGAPGWLPGGWACPSEKPVYDPPIRAILPLLPHNPYWWTQFKAAWWWFINYLSMNPKALCAFGGIGICLVTGAFAPWCALIMFALCEFGVPALGEFRAM